ncbi:MAG TPA: hypothetical protein VE621_03340 [Bryobacteraceae bacterium]|jgi:hypothetical protein|nr:hypothetical protein [Bryobacteraceae bacterium]
MAKLFYSKDKKFRMKRKPIPTPVDDEVVETESPASAAQAAEEDKGKATRCVICSSEAAPNSTEQLCWVCRRLKISAWRDSETQLSAQE